MKCNYRGGNCEVCGEYVNLNAHTFCSPNYRIGYQPDTPAMKSLRQRLVENVQKHNEEQKSDIISDAHSLYYQAIHTLDIENKMLAASEKGQEQYIIEFDMDELDSTRHDYDEILTETIKLLSEQFTDIQFRKTKSFSRLIADWSN